MSAVCPLDYTQHHAVSPTMTIDPALTQRRLKDGLEALRTGNRVKARDLLLAVVQADGDNEAAWWGLAQAADGPQEQQRALEQVVRLNPGRVEAHTQLLGL